MAKKPMTKSDIIEAMAKDAGINKKEAAAALESLVSMITGQAEGGIDFRLSGLGGFTVRNRSARKVRNPATGEMMQVAASKSLAFKQSKVVQDLLNPKK